MYVITFFQIFKKVYIKSIFNFNMEKLTFLSAKSSMMMHLFLYYESRSDSDNVVQDGIEIKMIYIPFFVSYDVI